MIPPELSPPAGKTLFKVAANGRAVLITRAGNRMRRRHINFADDYAALDWCMDRQIAFVLVPRETTLLN